METSLRAIFTAIHGMLFGAFFLMALFGLLAELFRSLHITQPAIATPRGQNLEKLYLIATVLLGWAAVLSGAYIVYPWYRAVPPAGLGNLAAYPQALLKSSPASAQWHFLGMEWKEHVAWFAAIAVTMVAVVLLRYKPALRRFPQIRTAVVVFAAAAFFSAGIAGFFGAMINKEAPVNGGATFHMMGAKQ
jgi:hypothetical protein